MFLRKANKKILVGILFILMIGIFFYAKIYSNLSSPEIVWKMDAKNIFGGVYVKDQMAYFGTLDGYFKAVDAKTGSPKWNFKLRDKEVIGSKPVISDEVVYFLNDQRNDTYSLDIKNGQEVEAVEGKEVSIEDIKKTEKEERDYKSGWLLRSGGTNKSAILEDKNIQFYEEKHYLYATDKDSGTTIWKIKSGRAYNPPILSDNALYYLRMNYIFPGDSHWQSLHAVDLETGSSKWNWNKRIQSDPILANGILYFISEDYLYAVK